MTVLDERRPAQQGFFAGGGEMGALIRAHDWAATPLGPAERWPQPLKTSVSTCLDCAFPILLWWGPELVMLYNDEYRPILGRKHPRALGAPGRDVWPEIWDVIGPMLDRVIRGGRATRSRDLRLVMDRDGYDEETWFTFSFSPIRDEAGAVSGVFCPVIETTPRVLAERRLRVLTDLESAAASGRTRSVAETEALCLSALDRDCPDAPLALLYALEGDGARLAGSAGAPAGAFAPATVPLEGGVWPIAALLRHEAPLVDLDPAIGAPPATEGGPPVERALVLPAPRRGPGAPGAALVLGVNPLRALDEDYRSFLERVADATAIAIANARALERERGRRLSEEEQRARDSVFRAVADHAPAIIWLGDAEGRTAWLSRGWRELTGQAPDHPPHEAWFAAVHPEDAPRVRVMFQKAAAERAPFRTEYRLRNADGGAVWVLDVARPRIAEDGRYLGHIGAIMDIDDRRRAEQHRTLLIDELNHRVKNTLSIVQGIAQQSLRGHEALHPAVGAFEGRLGALAAAHALLTSLNWESAALGDIVRAAIRPVCGERDARVRVTAEPLRIRPKQAVSIAIALHELATNALKYGALSADGGRVEIDWTTDAGTCDGSPRVLRFSWTESGGPPVAPPARRGFGSRLIERALAAELGGAASLDFRAEGLVCRIEAPLSEGVGT